MKNFAIKSFEIENIEEVRLFTDQWIGKNYFSSDELRQLRNKSIRDNLNASLLALSDTELIGVRIALAPGSWIESNMKLSPSYWGVAPERVGYFKSLFIHEKFRSLGVGSGLTESSKAILKQQGAKAIITHSWLESPNNSSQVYLLRHGFSEIARYPKFWEPLEYECVRCGPQRCQCTAVEMICHI